MKQGWELKKLGDVCEIVNGSTPLKSNKNYWDGGDFSWFTIEDIRTQGREINYTKQHITQLALNKIRVLPIDSVLLCCTASIGEYAITKIELSTNQQFNGLIVKNKLLLLPLFLLYFSSTLKDTLSGLSGKTTIDFIPISRLKEISIPIPPLPEQQKIVAILDQAFSAIDQAKQNAKQNLKHTKELFNSYLQNIDAKKVALNDLVNITTGRLNSNEAVDNGEYPFFTCSRDVFAINKYAFDLEAILLAGNNASGDFNVKHYKGKFNAYQRTYVITVNEKSQVLYRYLYFQLLNSLKEFKNQSVGANTRFLKIGMIYNLQIPLPNIEEQNQIINTLDNLLFKTQQLEAIYQHKLIELEELKKSILQKAFNGELKIN